jgi:phthalate 4,5-dioxygenase
MLSTEDNVKITRVGRGTPMGDLVRRYWVPFLESRELDQPDGEPVRVRLMGEDLVAFRDSDGRPGLVGKYCPHRRADMWYGRNEEAGLRCTYHGWKFDVTGACVDMPTETAESRFADKVRLNAYPVAEKVGVLWTYMGPPEHQPEMPHFEWMDVPSDHLYASWIIEECNYVQAIEGGIDSAHVNFLHSNLNAHRPQRGDSGKAQQGEDPQKGGALSAQYMRFDTAPRFFTQATDYGLLIGARRNAGGDGAYWRLNNFLMPFWTTPPGTAMHAFVPIDDEHCYRWSFTWRVDRPYNETEFAAMHVGVGVHSAKIPGTHTPVQNKTNNYMIDRYMQKHFTYTGISDFGQQDASIQEGMDPISDRTEEHLGVTDIGIIAMRRMLLRAATDLREGFEPPSTSNPESYAVHGGQVLVPDDAKWGEDARFTEAVGSSYSATDVA